MSIIESSFIALALAMDCFTVSIGCGISQRRMGMQALCMALLFGLFQALMPLVGWFTADLFSKQIEVYDHWFAFALLTFIGGRMMWESRKGRKENKPILNPSSPVVLLTLAVATSIDALAVGFSFLGMGLRTFSSIIQPLIVIGLFSFVLSLFGKYVGVKIGKHLHLPAERLGGAILVLIGFKVLIQHLMAA